MNAFFAGALFMGDGLLTAVTAWLVLRAVGDATKGMIEPLLGWGLMMTGLVAGPGVVLGLTGLLGPTGFLAAHGVLLVLCVGRRRREWRADLAQGSAWLAEVRQAVTAKDWIARGCAALVAVIGGLALLAAVADPLIHDALAYRLPRIGLWLSEGRTMTFETADARINYMPWVPDLLTVWLLGASTSGWLLVALPQVGGGVLLLVATIGLARQAGLSRAAALGAAGLVLGLANIAVQFTTAQTDLFVAGVLAAAVCLWQGAMGRRQGSAIGGLGAGLALGSKGTVFYLAPGLLVLVIYVALKHRLPWREWRRTFAGAALGVALWVVPSYGMNFLTYGSGLGPAASVALHHGEGGLSWSDRAAKLWINLRTSAVQLFDPHAQPAGLRTAARGIGLQWAEQLPGATGEPFTFQHLNRRRGVEEVLNLPNPNPDILGVGVLPVAVFLLAVIVLAVSRKPEDGRGLVWAGAAAVVIYVIYHHAIVQWHVWELRLMTLAGPWWAVTVAAGLAAAPRWVRVGGWTILLTAGLSVFWHVTTQTPQAGWQAVVHPQGAPSHLVATSWRQWARTLQPEGSGLTLALESNRPVAAFLRDTPTRTIQLRQVITDGQTMEKIVAAGDGWVVTPLSQFRGREGAVLARTWINPSDSGEGYSVAAYRKLAPGEKAAPVLYRNRRADTDKNAGRSLLVRTWSAGAVQFVLNNPRAEDCHWLALTSAGEHRGAVAAGGTASVTINLPADGLTEVMILFRCPPGELAPEVDLAEQ